MASRMASRSNASSPMTYEEMQARAAAAVELVRELKERPGPETLVKFSTALKSLGLPAVDTTPGETYDPFADPRMGSQVAINKVKFAALSISDADLQGLETDVNEATTDSERWAKVIGTLAIIGLRLGAAFAKFA